MDNIIEFPEVNPQMLVFNGLKKFCDECGPFTFCMVIYQSPGSDAISCVVPQGARSRDETIGLLVRTLDVVKR